MKYVDAGKLIDMIDTSIAYCQINYSDDYALGFEQSLRDVKNFIASLQQVQPEAELEKEIDSFFPESYFETAINFDDVVDIARHFYELGRIGK